MSEQGKPTAEQAQEEVDKAIAENGEVFESGYVAGKKFQAADHRAREEAILKRFEELAGQMKRRSTGDDGLCDWPDISDCADELLSTIASIRKEQL
jgi:hypothetical protein